jgi:hypothetical protein
MGGGGFMEAAILASASAPAESALSALTIARHGGDDARPEGAPMQHARKGSVAGDRLRACSIDSRRVGRAPNSPTPGIAWKVISEIPRQWSRA